MKTLYAINHKYEPRILIYIKFEFKAAPFQAPVWIKKYEILYICSQLIKIGTKVIPSD